MTTATIEYLSTPEWAETLVIGQIDQFTDLQLSVMKIFISDEMAKRAESKQLTEEAA